MRNPPLLSTAPASAGPADTLLLLLGLLVVAGALLLVARRRRDPGPRDPEPVVEILEPADEAAETVGVGERVILQVTLAHATPQGKLVLETPDGRVETSLEGRRTLVRFRLETPGEHELRLLVTTPDGTRIAEETFPLRVIRYEDALERPSSDREAYLAQLRRSARQGVTGRGSPG